MNPNLELREYKGEHNLHIDGRYIPYQIVTVTDYLFAKNDNWNYDDIERFSEENYEIYERLNQIIALKQSCVLLRHTSHSCGSLSESLYSLKLELIRELKEKYDYNFDEELMESFQSSEEIMR